MNCCCCCLALQPLSDKFLHFALKILSLDPQLRANRARNNTCFAKSKRSYFWCSTPYSRDRTASNNSPPPGSKGWTCPGSCPGGVLTGQIEPCIRVNGLPRQLGWRSVPKDSPWTLKTSLTIDSPSFWLLVCCCQSNEYCNKSHEQGTYHACRGGRGICLFSVKNMATAFCFVRLTKPYPIHACPE